MLNVLNSDPPQSNAEYFIIKLCLSNQTQQPHAIVLKWNILLRVHCLLCIASYTFKFTENYFWHCVSFSKNVVSQYGLLDQLNPLQTSTIPRRHFLVQTFEHDDPWRLWINSVRENMLLVYFWLTLMGEEKLYKPIRALHKTCQYFAFSNIMKFNRWETGLLKCNPNWKKGTCNLQN